MSVDDETIDIETPGMLLRFLALVWGLAEATLFFLAPSILVSYVALRHGVFQGLFVGAFVAGGATLGGILLYLASSYQQAEVQALLLQLPGVNVEGLRQALTAMQKLDALAVLASAYNSLVPYKVYAAEAKAAAVPGFTFGLATIFHYLSRVFLAALIAGGLGMVLKYFLRRRTIVAIWAMIWIAAYGLYFGRFYL